MIKRLRSNQQLVFSPPRFSADAMRMIANFGVPSLVCPQAGIVSTEAIERRDWTRVPPPIRVRRDLLELDELVEAVADDDDGVCDNRNDADADGAIGARAGGGGVGRAAVDNVCEAGACDVQSEVYGGNWGSCRLSQPSLGLSGADADAGALSQLIAEHELLAAEESATAAAAAAAAAPAPAPAPAAAAASSGGNVAGGAGGAGDASGGTGGVSGYVGGGEGGSGGGGGGRGDGGGA
eukprot:6182780-Pleurochrysis_carterae.AAC.1